MLSISSLHAISVGKWNLICLASALFVKSSVVLFPEVFVMAYREIVYFLEIFVLVSIKFLSCMPMGQ